MNRSEHLRSMLVALALTICTASGSRAEAQTRPASNSGGGTAAKIRVFGDPNLWQWPPSQTYHVENYKLKLRFDQAQGEVFGDEVLTLRPFLPHFRRF